jgi:TPR repeat protein
LVGADRDAVRASLAARLRAQGLILLDQRDRLNGFLQDDCPEPAQRPPRLQLLTALEEQVPQRLLEPNPALSTSNRIAMNIARLRDERGMQEETARWAVESWALALGIPITASSTQAYNNPQPYNIPQNQPYDIPQQTAAPDLNEAGGERKAGPRRLAVILGSVAALIIGSIVLAIVIPPHPHPNPIPVPNPAGPVVTNGDGSSACNASVAYLDGTNGTAQDLGKAQSLYETAGREGYFCRTPVPANLQLTDANPSFDTLQDLANQAAGTPSAFWQLEGEADAGNEHAAALFGNLFDSSITPAMAHPLPPDDLVSLNWYEIAAKAGDGVAACNASIDLLFGTGATRDDSAAETYYQDSIADNNPCEIKPPSDITVPTTDAELDTISNTAATDPEKFWALEGATNAGNAYADLLMGSLYDKYLSTPYQHAFPANQSIAIQWYTTAANLNNGVAACNLSNSYVNGLGVAEDQTQAASWYQKATADDELCQDSTPSDVATPADSDLYDLAKSAASDTGKFWELEGAADNGNKVAEYYMGSLYDKFLTPAYQPAMAPQSDIRLQWYQLSAKAGYAPAACNLSVIYDDGLDVPKDYQMALSYYQSAINGHDDDCKRPT